MIAKWAAVTMACAAVLAHVPAAAQQAPEPPRLTVRTAVKATGLASWMPDARALFPESSTGDSMLRLRVDPELRVRNNIVVNVAYEQRMHYTSAPSAGLAAAALLPADAGTPFRIRPLIWRAVSDAGVVSWRHEIDRANAQVHLSRADVTLGRQAIGWGRGVLFTAVDLFAPFSPLEVDREWRAGVDAARADIKLTDRSSLDLAAVFGDTLDRSAFAARARGYAGTIDVEVAGGRRGQDLFGGVSSSAAVGDAELHGEAAAFRVPADTGHDVVWKVVAGGSFRVPVGNGVLVYGEYHYSGFGAGRAEQIVAKLQTPSFADRFARGDMQILSRHAIGVTASYESSPELTYSGQWVHNPGDRSGIIAPAVTYTFNDSASLLGAVYVSYGRPPDGVVLQSEYGAASRSALLQLRWYC